MTASKGGHPPRHPEKGRGDTSERIGFEEAAMTASKGDAVDCAVDSPMARQPRPGNAVDRLLGSTEKVHVDSDVSRTYVLASERDDWKARAEKAEAALAASGPNAEAWEKWQADFKREVEAVECWKARADKAEAACAEMRAALEMAQDSLVADQPACIEQSDGSCCAHHDKLLPAIARALSSDAGKGWTPLGNYLHNALECDRVMRAKGWVPPEEYALASYNANDFYHKYVALKKSLVGWVSPEEHVSMCKEAFENGTKNPRKEAFKGWVPPEEHKKAVKEANDAGFDEAWAQREKDLYSEGWRPRGGWAPPEVVAQAIAALEGVGLHYAAAYTKQPSSWNVVLHDIEDALKALREVAK